jgi:propanol-preferring alcohol dehydrogenase
MSGTMLAYRMLDWQEPPRAVEVDKPEPAGGEVLVRVAGNGLCHSDVGMAHIPAEIGEHLGWHMPFTLGHEIGGWVDGLGAGVEGMSVGDPVALVSPYSCGTCAFCIRAHDSACIHGTAGRGYGRDGGLAQFVVARAPRDVIKLKRYDPVAAGPLTDAGATSYHAVKRVLPRLVPGATAVVVGTGGLGAFAVQFLKVLSPARVVAVDVNPARLDLARELGADDALVGVGDSTTADLATCTEGRGAEAVLDFVGADATISAGLASVRPAGAFGLIGAGGGTFRGPWYGRLPREAEVFTFQGSTIADAHEVVALAEAGLIRNEVDVFPFDHVGEAYAKLERGELRGRAVVTPPA